MNEIKRSLIDVDAGQTASGGPIIHAVLPLGNFFDSRYSMAASFLAQSGGKDMNITTTPSEYCAYYWLHGRNQGFLDPRTFRALGPMLDKIHFYRLISTTAIDEHTYRCQYVGDHGNCTTDIRALIKFENGKPELSNANVQEELSRLLKVKNEILDILRNQNYSIKDAHHGNDQGKFIQKRVGNGGLSYRNCDRYDAQSLIRAETKVADAMKTYGFTLPESKNGKPMKKQKGPRLEEWRALRVFTIETYCLCLEGLDRIIGITEDIANSKNKPIKGCEVWEHVQMFERAQNATEYKHTHHLARPVNRISIRAPGGVLEKTLHTEDENSQCYNCNTFELFRDHGKWNMVFDPDPKLSTGLNHDTLTKFIEFRKAVDLKFRSLHGKSSMTSTPVL